LIHSHYSRDTFANNGYTFIFAQLGCSQEMTPTQMAVAYNLVNPTSDEEETASSTGWTKKTFDSLFDEVDDDEESQS
jgi:hypothetical protein